MDIRPQLAPPRWLLVASVVLCLAGLAVAADLTSIHFNVHTNPRYQSFCAISKEVNCDTVAQSDWSVFLGLPISVWGIFGYLAMGVLAAWGLTRRAMHKAWPWGLLLLLSTFSIVVAAVLLVISKFIIHSMCLMCIASWLVSLALLVLAIMAVRKVGLRTALKEDFGALVGQPGLTGTLVVVAIAVLGTTEIFYPHYWELSGPVGPGPLKTGVDEKGSPWIGAEAPVLTIEEFSDYECPFCSRAHRNVRDLIEARADKVRLVHRNYPLDQACNPAIKRPFHLSACHRAKAAICAGEQGKFWEMNDLLFLGQRRRGLDVESLAKKLGMDVAKLTACMADERVAAHLLGEMDMARSHGVNGTPSYLIQGQLLTGALSAQELDKRLNQSK